MSLLQFMRILWARRMIIAVTTLSALIAAIIAIQVLPPRYQAEARLEFDVSRPDPVTGEQVASQFARAFTKTQENLLDLGVARAAVDRLGLTRDPELQQAYRDSDVAGDVDFRTWAAQHVLARAEARFVEGSHILAITYIARTADMARDGANALRSAYVEDTAASRRTAAAQNAQWYVGQAQLANAQLQRLEAAKTQFEREHGLILEDNVDVDTARLQALASQGPGPAVSASRGGGGSSAASAQLAQVEAQMAQASRTYGPNHPQMQELEARRSALAQQVARDTVASAPGPVVTGGGTERAYQAQRARVIGQRDELNQLRRMQNEIEVQRAEYVRLAQRATELRQEAAAPSTRLLERDAAVAPERPVFPNVPLMLIGAFGFGFGLGILLALLSELLARRVRGVEDLAGSFEVPVLVVISSSGEQRLIEGPGSGRIAPS